jgi:hypothetical protein
MWGGGVGLDSLFSELGPVPRCGENGNKPSGSLKGKELLDCLRDCCKESSKEQIAICMIYLDNWCQFLNLKLSHTNVHISLGHMLNSFSILINGTQMLKQWKN